MLSVRAISRRRLLVLGVGILVAPRLALARPLAVSGARTLALLKEAVPSVSRVAVLMNPENPSHALALRAAQNVAQPWSIELRPHKARDPKGLRSAFAAIDQEYASAVLILSDPVLLAQRHRIVKFAVPRWLPTAADFVELALAGGLIGFSPGPREALVLNVRAAKAMRITFPQSVLRRATQVIE